MPGMFFNHPEELERLHQEIEIEKRNLLQLYAPRRPMAQLPDKYRVTKTNSRPPDIYFAIPLITAAILDVYAEKHNLHGHPFSVLLATRHLSRVVQYKLEFRSPFQNTSDCDFILALYSNYTIDQKMLIDKDQEDVIQLVQEELGLDPSVRPKWYFDADDPWEPDDSEDEYDPEDECNSDGTV